MSSSDDDVVELIINNPDAAQVVVPAAPNGVELPPRLQFDRVYTVDAKTVGSGPADWVERLIDFSKAAQTKAGTKENPIVLSPCKLCRLLHELADAKVQPFPIQLRKTNGKLAKNIPKMFYWADSKIGSNNRQTLRTHLAGQHGVKEMTDVETGPFAAVLEGDSDSGWRLKVLEQQARDAYLKFVADQALPLSAVESPSFRTLVAALRRLPPAKNESLPLPSMNNRRSVVKHLRIAASKAQEIIIKLVNGRYYALHLDIGTVHLRYVEATLRIYKSATSPLDKALVDMKKLPPPSAESDVYHLQICADTEWPFDETARRRQRDLSNVDENTLDDGEAVVGGDLQPLEIQFSGDVDDEEEEEEEVVVEDQDHQRFTAAKLAKWLKEEIVDPLQKAGGVLLNISTDNGSNFRALLEECKKLELHFNPGFCFAHVGQLLAGDLYRSALTAAGAKKKKAGQHHVPVFLRALLIYNEFRRAAPEFKLPTLVLTRWSYDLIWIKHLAERLRLSADDTKHIPSDEASTFASVVKPMKLHNTFAGEKLSAVQSGIRVLEMFVNVFSHLKRFTDWVQHDGATLGVQGLVGLSELYSNMVNSSTVAVIVRDKIKKAFNHRLFRAKGQFMSPSLALLVVLFPFKIDNQPRLAERQKCARIIIKEHFDTLGFTTTDNSPLLKSLREFFKRVGSLPDQVVPVRGAVTADHLQTFWSNQLNIASTCVLGYLMCCVLRMAVSEASVERVFSVLGWSMDDRKNRTSPENVAAFLALRFRKPFESSTPESLGGHPLHLPVLAEILDFAIRNYSGDVERAVDDVEDLTDVKERCAKCLKEITDEETKVCGGKCKRSFCREGDCGRFEKNKVCSECRSEALFGQM